MPHATYTKLLAFVSAAASLGRSSPVRPSRETSFAILSFTISPIIHHDYRHLSALSTGHALESATRASRAPRKADYKDKATEITSSISHNT